MTTSMLTALQKAEPKPAHSAKQPDKTQYAKRLSDRLAECLARDLQKRFGKRFSGIVAGETLVKSKGGMKRLDVNYSTPLSGLELGVSIKTISHKDGKSGRYTHNMKRVDEEFLAEAMDYHVRQPYAVLVGLHFMPVDGCNDSRKKTTPSSFGSWTKKLFARTGRTGRRGPKDNPELFERMYIGLFQPDGPRKGDVYFFDVRKPPPLQGEPAAADRMTWEGLLDAINDTYSRRNAGFQWAGADVSEPEDEPEDVAGDE